MRKIITLALVVAPLALMAQMRIATVDVQAVFNALPETKVAAEKLDQASKQLKAEYEAAHHIGSNGKTYTTAWSWKFNSLQFEYRQAHPFVE